MVPIALPTLIKYGTFGLGALGGVGKMFGRAAANRRMNTLLSQMPQYVQNPIVAQQLAMTQALLNARMPGASQAEQNIYQTQANQIAASERASTDPNQMLLAGQAATGMANQAFGQLSQTEAADYQRRYGNLVTAQQNQIAEEQKAYEDQLRRYQMMAQIKAGQQENRQNTWGDISNLGFAGAYLGQQGFFDDLFKKKTATPSGTAATT